MAAIVMRYCFSTSANCSAVPSSWPARSVFGERHRRGIQIGKAQILAHALQGVCCAEGFLHILFLQGSFQIVEAVILGKQQHKLADHCFVVQATEYFVVICAHLCITFLDRHDMLIPFCPADCLFLFSIKIIS